MAKSFGERVAEAKQAVKSVSPAEASALRDGCEPVVFVDPRPADAIAETTGIIPGAKNVLLDDIVSGNLPEGFGDKYTRIFTACQGGPMGAIAAHELLKLGYDRVQYVEGGTQGWLDAGLPTDR
jgi:rhodanese-related sulfurtransferase